jgi:hypothetical protein
LFDSRSELPCSSSQTLAAILGKAATVSGVGFSLANRAKTQFPFECSTALLLDILLFCPNNEGISHFSLS